MPDSIQILMLDESISEADLNDQILLEGDQNFEIIRVDNKSDFKVSLNRTNPQLVIASNNLPEYDALSVLKDVRTFNRTLPIIIVSSEAEDNKNHDLDRYGVQDHIHKETRSTLSETVRKVLTKSQKEVNLRTDVERYRLIFNSSLDGVWDWDIVKDSLYLSPRWKSQLGYADEELENSFKTWCDLLHPDDSRIVLTTLDAFLQNPRSIWDQEFRLRHKNGDYIWINSRGSTVRNDEGKVVRILGVHIDINQRKLAETRVLKEQSLLDTVFQAIPDLLFLLDTDGTIRDYRAGKHDDLYLPAEAFLGKRIQDLFPEPISNQFLHNLKQSLQYKQLVTMEYALDMPQGMKQYEARINQLSDEGQLVVVVRDVTRSNKTQSELTERLKEMRCLFDVLKDMQEVVEEDVLCHRIILHIVSAMQFPEITVPVIEIYDRIYAHDTYRSDLSRQIRAPVSARDTVIGHIRVYYSGNQDFLLPEEQELINTLSELLGSWVDRRQVGKELDVIQERYRLINGLIPGAIYITTAADFHSEYISDGASELLGLDSQRPVNQSESWINMIVSEDRDFYNDCLQQSLQSDDTTYDIEYRIKHAVSGEIKWVSDRAFIERDEKGHATRFFGLMLDITSRKEWEQQLRMYERIASTTREFMSFVDTSYTYRIVNDAYARSFGKSKEDIIGHKVEELLGHDVFEKMSRPNLEKCFNGEEVNFKAWYPVGPGLKYLDVSYHPYHDEKNDVIGAVVASKDVTSMMEAQEKIRQAAQVFKSTIEGVTITDLDGTILDVNEAFTEITGYSHAEAVGQNPRLLKSGLHDSKFYERLWGHLLKTGHWRGEIWNRRKDGYVYPELLNISTVTDDNEISTGYVAVFSDITSNKRTEKRLDFLAHHDPLTRLPNRLLLNTRLSQSIKHAKRSKQQLAVLFVDLDRFKNVNDTLGHQSGDELLKQIAKRLTDCIRLDDTVARISGDEFVILLEKVGSVDDCSTAVHKVMQTFDKPFKLNQEDFRMTCSIGISLYPHDGDNSEVLLRNADTAMYRAKEDSRNSYQFYTAEMTTSTLEHIFIENALRSALRNDEFQLVYQPQINLVSHKIIGLEALIRWNHPQQGSISPIMFIPIAEQTGLIREIGAWVLESACTQARQWLDQGLEFGRVAVNVSGAQIQHQNFADLVISTLEKCQLAEQYLELEVTESFVMKHAEEGIQQLKRLNDQGISISVDDFGTGYSSLSYLKSLPVDKLKIDQSFVRDIPDDPDDIAISEAIIALASALKLKVIAEGVETGKQVEILLNKGCDEAQGYFYSRPLSVLQVEEKLNGNIL